LDVGIQAMLTQISDAMHYGTGVKDLSGDNDTSNFGTPSFVIVSHSTGALVTDTSLRAAALHLNLTGWVSTERDWHQDNYLNPPEVNGHYAGVWTALDQIQADAGPFEFVPGSHRWPIIRQAKVLELLGYDNGDDPSWPWASERLLTPFFEREIASTGLKPERFLGAKGDVLIWHSRLVHRGSLPERPNAERRSMIAHYSAISRRADMRRTRQHPGGGQYFFLDGKADDAPPKAKRFRWF